MQSEIEGHALFWSKCVEPYQDLKKKHPDVLLFFRNDDYYEILFDDARVVSKVLEIPLAEMTVSDFSKMTICIFRVEKQGDYIDRLIGEGWKVMICEDPNNSGK